LVGSVEFIEFVEFIELLGFVEIVGLIGFFIIIDKPNIIIPIKEVNRKNWWESICNSLNPPLN